MTTKNKHRLDTQAVNWMWSIDSIMKLNAYCLVFLLSLFLALPSQGHAGGDFRCDGRIVSPGDRIFEVLVKCGEPSYRAVRLEKRIKRDFFRELFPPKEPRESEKFREPRFVEEIVEIEEWVYNFGSTQFIRFLTFENGILVNIETGDYGY
jgi:hypothetical protein